MNLTPQQVHQLAEFALMVWSLLLWKLVFG
jgi:hypothetical protein